ncbi:MAG: HD domain-containing protein [Candidatus Margulisiibacteriota bacterium]
MVSPLVEIKLLTPAGTYFGGQGLRISLLNGPSKIAPFIHHTQVARELAERPVIAHQTVLQFGKLRVTGINVVGETIDLAYSGREIGLRDIVLGKYSSPQGRDRILNAFDFAKDYTKAKTRKDGEPYICHPADVAEIAHTQFGANSVDLAIACFLHDVLEDIDVTFSAQDLAERVGERPARIVDLVTRREDQSAEDYMAQVISDPDSGILKCADQFSNAGKLYQLFDHGVRQRLTHKYYPEIQDTLYPWALKNGYELISRTLEQWLWSSLTLIDLARHLEDSEAGTKPVLIQNIGI